MTDQPTINYEEEFASYSALARHAMKFLTENKEGYKLEFLSDYMNELSGMDTNFDGIPDSLVLRIPVPQDLPIVKFHEEIGATGKLQAKRTLDMNDILEQVAMILPETKYSLNIPECTEPITGNEAELAFKFCMIKHIRLYISDQKLYAEFTPDKEPELIARFRSLAPSTEGAYVLFFFEYLMKNFTITHAD